MSRVLKAAISGGAVGWGDLSKYWTSLLRIIRKKVLPLHPVKTENTIRT